VLGDPALRIYGIIFSATLSTVFLPLPEEATLLAAGYAARVGQVTLPGAVLAGGLAVLLGDAFSYFVGRVLLARLLGTRLGQRLLPESWRRWGEQLVAGHGARAIVVARFLVGLRGFVYFAVGASRYPFGRFLAVDGLVGLVEVGGLVALGYAFGELRHRAGAARCADLAIALALAAALFGPVLVRGLVRRRGTREKVNPTRSSCPE
jgi:membrane protein DedA with SNARE-associated domain